MIDPVDSTLAAVLPRKLSGEETATNRPRLSRGTLAAYREPLLVVLLAAVFTIAAQLFTVTVHSRAGVTMIDTVAALISALAAFVFLERRRSARGRRDLVIALVLSALGIGNLVVAAEPAMVSAHPLSAHPLSGYLQAGAAALAIAAAVILARHAAQSEDGLKRSLACGAAVLGIAHLNYLLAPKMQGDWLYGGDMLKLCAFLLILRGCVVEFHTLQRKLAQRVAVDERRRMARDMHDGLAQELAFIASHSQRLRHTGEDATTVAHLQSAAERALHDSRTTIAVLTAAEDVPLDQLILRTIDSVRSRFGVEIEVELERDVLVGAEERNALLRILHEALINAVRHGSAENILVRLGEGASAGHSLRIADDGGGFDVPATIAASKGLGLTSMQERAGILGAKLSIASTPGAGTIVEVELA
jgi:signal transduction histidine kinase